MSDEVPMYTDGKRVFPLPSFTSDINAAMLLKNKLEQDGLKVMISAGNTQGSIRVEISGNDVTESHEADSLPLAISVASLKYKSHFDKELKAKLCQALAKGSWT